MEREIETCLLARTTRPFARQQRRVRFDSMIYRPLESFEFLPDASVGAGLGGGGVPTAESDCQSPAIVGTRSTTRTGVAVHALPIFRQVATYNNNFALVRACNRHDRCERRPEKDSDEEEAESSHSA